MMEGTERLQASARQLERLIDELKPRQLLSALKAASRTEARRVRKAAYLALCASGVAHAREMAVGYQGRSSRPKGLRWRALKSGAGFIVTIAPKPSTNLGLHKSHTGHYKRGGKAGQSRPENIVPLLMWVNNSTGKRTSKGRDRGRMLGGHGVHFLEAAERSELPASKERMVKEFNIKITKIAMKYGKL